MSSVAVDLASARVNQWDPAHMLLEDLPEMVLPLPAA